MNVSTKTDKSAQSEPIRRPFFLLSLFLLLLAMSVLSVFYQPKMENVIWRATDLSLIEADNPHFLQSTSPSPEEIIIGVDDVGATHGVGWIRTTVDIETGVSPIPPYALFVSGLFSAEVYWDGQKLGSKGSVGDSRSTEVPGPIDSVLYIPESLSAPGLHVLVLRFSNSHLGYDAESLIHSLAVGAYQSDPRRQLRYYSLPVILSGGFLLLVFQFSRVFVSSGSRSALTLAGMSAFILLQLASEVSRSVVDYSYDWHLIRSFCIWLFAFLAMISLNLLVCIRSPTLWINRWLPISVATALVVSIATGGFDNKTTYAIYVLSLPPLWFGFKSVQRKPVDLIMIAAAGVCASWLMAGFISSLVLLDRTFYMTSISFLAIVWFWISQGSEPVERNSPESTLSRFFYVRHTGRIEKIPANDVLFLKACGNYTELECVDGRTVLHHQRLGQIMENPPIGFLRVHRSHAINQGHIVGLRSLEGSRYFAQLEGGIEVPVSRYQVKEVRSSLNS